MDKIDDAESAFGCRTLYMVDSTMGGTTYRKTIAK